MANLPALSGRQAIGALERAGFSVVRVSGSHNVLKKDGHRNNVSVPVHSNKPLKKGTLKGVIQQAGMTDDEFMSYLR